MTYKEYLDAGGVTIIYPGNVTPLAPEGYFWKAMYHSGELKSHKLLEKPKVTGCKCH